MLITKLFRLRRFWASMGLAIACLLAIESPVQSFLGLPIHDHEFVAVHSSARAAQNVSDFIDSAAPGQGDITVPRAKAEFWHYANGTARLAHSTELKIGISITGQGVDLMQRWQPTLDYLNDQVQGRTFVLIPMYDETMKEAVRFGQVDFVIPHSGLYIDLESRFGVNRIATFRNLLGDESHTVFGSVIFTSGDRDDLDSLKDLRQKNIVAVRDNTVEDWLGIKRELVDANINPDKRLSDVRFVGNARRVFVDVLEGRADAGVLRADQLNALAASRRSRRASIKVLHPRNFLQYPLPISTRLYPEKPFAALNHVPQELVQQVAIALLSIEPASDAATQLNSAGWAIPLSYQAVNDVYRQLRLGPYEDQGNFDLRAILWHYKRWILTVICLLMMGATTIYIQRREITRRRRSELALQQSQAQLQQRSNELEQALAKLQNTQAQLIQTEKMSSLGQLMAGIGHEINNPVNFIHGNIHYATQYTHDLLQLLMLYHDACPNPSSEIRDLEAAIDVDFVFDDLPKLLSSMQLGSERIREILHSLRIFSRVDEAELKAVDLHQGIDSTLMILQHRLKARHNRSSIGVFKHYGEMPHVECYAGQLNQVFMNILGNAIDALEERRISSGADDSSQAYPYCALPTIWIETQVSRENTARIVFRNNGPAISETVQRKLFNPFFTTKPIGKGTGLGLSISYQIVTEKHDGTLQCQSSPEEGVAFIIDIPIRHLETATVQSTSKAYSQSDISQSDTSHSESAVSATLQHPSNV
ncbi:MAG: PhnD/SsuA/transferrin family substrate-binding protein [Elainellaceae cyanobacterium]